MAYRRLVQHHQTHVWQFVCLLLSLYLLGVLYLNVSYLVHQPQRAGGRRLSPADLVGFDYRLYSLFGEDFILGRYRPRDCKPRKNFAFIKCMKCATETLGGVLRRYSYVHNLSVVLPVKDKIYLGWPFPMTPLDHRPSGREYNALIEHAIYNGTFMRSFMANGTAFLTILREPGDHFVSTLNYFNVFEIANVSVRHGMEAVHEYIRNIEKYETIYKRPAAEKRYCIPDGFSVSKNLLSQCLGMPLGFPSGTPNITDNARAVRQYIKALDKEFLLVMLMEYFDESLVLLRRLMCWTIKDILFHVSNVGSYRSKAARRPQLSPDDRAAHKRWSSVDYALYSHFNKTFWNKVGLQGPDFHYEVAHFRQVQKAVTSFCLNIAKYAGSQIEFPESFWSPPFNVSSSDCQLMTAPLLPLLKKRHEELEPQYANYPKVKVKRNYQPLC